MTCLKCKEPFRSIKARGLCDRCYQDVRVKGQLAQWPSIRARRVKIIVCRECKREGRHIARGLCRACYEKAARRGELARFPSSGSGQALTGVDVVAVKAA